MKTRANILQAGNPGILVMALFGLACAAFSALAAEPAGQPAVVLAPPARLGAAETMGCCRFQIIDWNGDGVRDIVQLSSGYDRGWVLLNAGTDREPWFERPVRLPINFSETEPQEGPRVKAMWIADMAGDGRLNIATLSPDQWPPQDSPYMAVDTGVPPFRRLVVGFKSKRPDPWDLMSPKWMCMADLDGDGKLEEIIYDSVRLRAFKVMLDSKSYELCDSWEIKDTNGKAVVAACPNPVDFDGDGVIDLFAVRMDKDGKNAAIVLYAGVKDSHGRSMQVAVPVVDEAGKPIPPGSDIGVVDWDMDGVLDLMVIDDSCVIRCHRGKEKGRPVFAAQGLPIIANAFGRMDESHMPSLFRGKDGRDDLLLRANLDQHCGAAFEATRVYRNILGSGSTVFGPGTFVTAGSKPLPWGALPMDDPCVCDVDGDGKLDLVFWRRKDKGAQVFLQRGEDAGSPLTPFKNPPEVLLTVPWTDLRPFAADWNGDGLLDLVIGANTAAGPRVFLVLNQGSNAAPTFGEPVVLSADGKELGFGNAVCVADWDRDGRPDLVGMVTGQAGLAERLIWQRNIDGSAKVGAATEITKNVLKGNMVKLSAGDIDGDGAIDLVMGLKYFDGWMALSEGQLWWFRGVPRAAPASVKDLMAIEESDRSVTLKWTPSAGATRWEVRYSPWPIDEATWFRATKAKEELGSGGDATVANLDAGKVYHFAVCHYGSKGERSAVSNDVTAATRPLRVATLVQGGAPKNLEVVKYSGSSGATVREQKDLAPVLGEALSLQLGVNSFLKFDLAPLRGKTVVHARLRLMRQSGRVEAEQMLCCREVLATWDPATVRYSTRDGSAKWAAGDLGAALPFPGGEPFTGIREWDATGAVSRVLKTETPVLSLQFSSDSKAENIFGSPDAKDPSLRPSLTVIYEESKK